MKKFILKNATSLCLVAVIALTAMALTACTKKSPRTEDSTQQKTAEQKQTAVTLTADPDDPNGSYAKILTGDLSAFAGTWVNGEGTRAELKPDGIFGNYAEYKDVKINNFRITADGFYSWSIGTEWFDSPVTLYPVGKDVIGGNGILKTDTTKVLFTLDNK